jgi:hypothetical protein
MKRSVIMAILTGVIAAGTCVAQDQAQQGTQTTSDNSSDNGGAKNETMKQCMARQKATNSGLTQLQMQTTCKNEMKSNKTHKEGNDLATGTQAGDKPPQQ